MDLRIYVLPDYVSFSGISVEEVPSMEGIHQGYFANLAFSNIWYHTVEMGAGIWANLTPDNYWGTDHAWLGDELPREMPDGTMTYDMSQGAWSDGLLVWEITWGWAASNSENGAVPVKTISSRFDQTFQIDEFGTVEVSKFGHTVVRGTNDVVLLDGIEVNGFPVVSGE